MAFDKELKTFVMYISILKISLLESLVYPDRVAQIAFLFIKKVTILD